MSTFFSPVSHQKPLGGGDKAKSSKGRTETTVWASILLTSGVVFLVAAFSLTGTDTASEKDASISGHNATTLPPTSQPALPVESTTTTVAETTTTTTQVQETTTAAPPATTTTTARTPVRRTTTIVPRRPAVTTTAPSVTTTVPPPTEPPTTVDTRPPAVEGKQPPPTASFVQDAVSSVTSGLGIN